MSLAQKSFVTAAVAPFLLAFGLAAANANAAEGVPIPAKTCFVSDASGVANVKLNAAMKAREQKILVSGNRVYPKLDAQGKPMFQEGYNFNVFTGNADKSEGYNIESNAPAGQIGSEYCVRAKYSNIKLYNAYASTGVHAELQNLGELGNALTYADARGLKVMLSAKVGNAILVVQGALQHPDRLGDLKGANSKGETGSMATLSDMEYGSYAKQLLGLNNNTVAALSLQ
ncbi:MAG: hypothetical protein AAB276_03160 [Pseudomonadota bacterium]